jgi:hypothetical protein
MKVYRATRRNQWKTTPRQKLAVGIRRRVPWAIFNVNFKREAKKA